MPIVIPEADLNHAFCLVLMQGKTLKEAATTIGINYNTLGRKIREAGYVVPKPPRQYGHDLPTDEIIALYKSGVSKLELSKRFNCSRTAITTRLNNHLIKQRSISENTSIQMSKLTFEERQKQASAANDALRGTKQCTERCK